MPGCCAYGCSNNTSSGFKIYAIPNSKREPERRKAWLAQINRLDFFPKKSTGLCEAHFAPSEFEKNIPRKLKPNAIPSLFCYKTEAELREPPKRPVSRNQIPPSLCAPKVPHQDHAYAGANQYTSRESLCQLSSKSDPLCASQYLVAVKHLHDSTPIQPTKKARVADEDTPIMTPTDMNCLEPYRWTGKAVRLLITLRREMDDQFERPRCKKLRLWDEIAMKMMDAGNYVVSGFVCDKKWRNLLSTYRRIKDKNQQDKSTWEYFDLIDDWVGQKAPASPPPVELRGESDVSLDGLSSSSSSEPFSDGSSVTYDATNGLKMNVDVRKSPAATVNRPAGRHKRACFCNDEPPKWFEEYLKQRLADQNKRYELEERRLALEAAQVKAMENLVAAIAATVRKGNMSS